MPPTFGPHLIQVPCPEGSCQPWCCANGMTCPFMSPFISLSVFLWQLLSSNHIREEKKDDMFGWREKQSTWMQWEKRRVHKRVIKCDKTKRDVQKASSLDLSTMSCYQSALCYEVFLNQALNLQPSPLHLPEHHLQIQMHKTWQSKSEK